MNNIANFDSDEEKEFNAWCEDALSLGMLSEIIYHPQAFSLSPRQTVKTIVQMKTKAKVIDAFLLHPHEYTADFRLMLTEYGRQFLDEKGLLAACDSSQMFVDVKGGFNIYHDDKQFSINQKWVFREFGVYIHKIVPKKWFARTWVPKLALYSPKQRKFRECYRGCKTIESIIRQPRQGGLFK